MKATYFSKLTAISLLSLGLMVGCAANETPTDAPADAPMEAPADAPAEAPMDAPAGQ